MRFQITFFILIIFTFLLTGCPSAETPNSNLANNAAPNKNTSELVPTTKPEAPTENNAPTLKPVVDAYYDAVKKKDDAALRKVLSADFIKSLEADMKADKKTGSLAAYIAEIEKTSPPVEVRNEKIDGDKGIAELKGGNFIGWTALEFAKENGEWKFTGKSPDIKKVSDAASNSNTTK
jgi:hypothetical protein